MAVFPPDVALTGFCCTTWQTLPSAVKTRVLLHHLAYIAVSSKTRVLLQHVANIAVSGKTRVLLHHLANIAVSGRPLAVPRVP